MNLNERVDRALRNSHARNYLIDNVDALRGNISEAEGRINKLILLILFLVGMAELLRTGSITSINLIGNEISFTNSNLVLVVIPVVISYYWYTLVRQIVLRNTLKDALKKTIKSDNRLIAALDLDELIVTKQDDSIESILYLGNWKWDKSVLLIISILLQLVFRFIPFVYCIFLYVQLFSESNFSFWMVVVSAIFSSLFFIRSTFLAIAAIKSFLN